MTFELLRNSLFSIKDIKPIGKTFHVGDVICHVMGITLQADGAMQLLVLEYDADYREMAEQAELEDINGAQGMPITNRTQWLREYRLPLALRISHAEKIRVGGTEFASSGSESGICSMGHWENAALFTRFLHEGWDPSGIDTHDTRYMYLTKLRLDGEYTGIPCFNPDDGISFSMRPLSEWRLTETPVTLIVGGDYAEKTYFTDKKTGQQRWIQINRVYLYDIWHGVEDMFADPRMKESVPADELERRRAELEACFAESCPKGMRFMAIDYECDDEMSVQFHSKGWLDEAPRHTSRATAFGIIVSSPEQGAGKLGMKLKTVLIQEPLPADTQSVEAELFRYHLQVAQEDIILPSSHTE